LQSPVTGAGERIRYLTVGGRTTAWVAKSSAEISARVGGVDGEYFAVH